MKNSADAFLDDAQDFSSDSDILANLQRPSPPVSFEETDMPIRGSGSTAKKGAPTKDDRKLLEEMFPSGATFTLYHIENGNSVYIGKFNYDEVRIKGTIDIFVADNFRSKYGGGEYHVFPIDSKTGRAGVEPRVVRVAHIGDDMNATVMSEALKLIANKEPRTVERTIERMERPPLTLAPPPAPVPVNPLDQIRDTHKLFSELKGDSPSPKADESGTVVNAMMQMNLQAQKQSHEREQALMQQMAAAQAAAAAQVQAAAQAARPTAPDPLLTAALEKMSRLEQMAMNQPPPPPPPPAPTTDWAAILSNPLVIGVIGKLFEPKTDPTAGILQAMQASADRQAELSRQVMEKQEAAQRAAAERQERLQKEAQDRQDAQRAADQARHEALILSLKPKEDAFSLRDILTMQKADADRALTIAKADADRIIQMQKEANDRTLALLSNQPKNNTSLIDEMERMKHLREFAEMMSPPSEGGTDTKSATVEAISAIAPMVNEAFRTLQAALKRPPAPAQVRPHQFASQNQQYAPQGIQGSVQTPTQGSVQVQGSVQSAPQSAPPAPQAHPGHSAHPGHLGHHEVITDEPEETTLTTPERIIAGLTAVENATADRDRINAIVSMFQDLMNDEKIGATALTLGRCIVQNRDVAAAHVIGNFMFAFGYKANIVSKEKMDATVQAMYENWDEIRDGLKAKVPFAEMLLGEGKILKERESDSVPEMGADAGAEPDAETETEEEEGDEETEEGEEETEDGTASDE